jgi:hypothetical protein
MYASFRRYRMGAGSMDDAMHLADTELADRLSEEPGFVDYQAVAIGDDMIVSMTIFEDEERASRPTTWPRSSCASIWGRSRSNASRPSAARSSSVARPTRSSSRRIAGRQ